MPVVPPDASPRGVGDNGVPRPATPLLARRRPAGPVARLLAAGLVLAAVATGPARAHDDPAHHRDEVSKRIEQSPVDASLYIQRADLSRALGEWIPAVQDLQTASRLAPERTEVDFLLARVLFEAGNDEAALAAADRAVERRPSDAGTRLLRARVLMRQGRKAEAAAAFTTGIDLAKAAGGRAQPDDYLDRARCHAAAGDAASLDAALRGLDEGSADLSGAVALELLAVELETSRADWSAAERRLARLEEKATRKEAWAARRAELLEKAGRTAEAADAWRRCLAAIAALPPRLRDSVAMGDLKARADRNLSMLTASARSNGTPAADPSPKPSPDPGPRGGEPR